MHTQAHQIQLLGFYFSDVTIDLMKASDYFNTKVLHIMVINGGGSRLVETLNEK